MLEHFLVLVFVKVVVYLGCRNIECMLPVVFKTKSIVKGNAFLEIADFKQACK